MKSIVLIGALIFAVAGLLGYNVIYKRSQERLHLVQTHIAQEQATQQMQADVAGLYRQIEQSRKRLAPAADPSWLVNQVVALGEQAGLKFPTIDREAPQELPQYTRLAVTLQFRATYHQLGTFLDRVERSSHYFRVERLDVVRPGSAAQPSSVTLVLSTMYVRPLTVSRGS